MDTVIFCPASKERRLIAIGIGFTHAKIASHENLLRFDDLHNQSGDAFPRDFRSPERPSSNYAATLSSTTPPVLPNSAECFA
jgi:hypothetical protein